MIFKNINLKTVKDVILKPMDSSHINQLSELAAEKKIWEYAPKAFYQPEVFKEGWFDKAIKQLEDKTRIPFVVCVNNKIAGASSYYEIDTENKKLNIGYTWFHPSFWGSGINAISKFILMEYIFNQLDFNRVSFSVDSINYRSCGALKKLGITQEGTLRNDAILANGRVRHSTIFSVIRDEWPAIEKFFKNKFNLL